MKIRVVKSIEGVIWRISLLGEECNCGWLVPLPQHINVGDASRSSPAGHLNLVRDRADSPSDGIRPCHSASSGRQKYQDSLTLLEFTFACVTVVPRLLCMLGILEVVSYYILESILNAEHVGDDALRTLRAGFPGLLKSTSRGPRTARPYSSSKGENPVETCGTSRYANRRYGSNSSQFLPAVFLSMDLSVWLNRSTSPSVCGAVALRSIDANTIAEELVQFFAVGIPEEILTDSKLLQELYRLLHIKPIRTTR